jgi:hypothetical protein
MGGKPLEMPGNFSSLRLSSSAAFYMSSLKFAIRPKRNTKTSLMRLHPSFGTVIMLKRKLLSLSESEDLSSGVIKIRGNLCSEKASPVRKISPKSPFFLALLLFNSEK